MSESTSLVCPNLAARVSSDLGSSGLRYWTELGGSQTSKSHTECSARRCYANDSKYNHATAVRHHDISCHCASIGPSMVKIAELINSNLIPVIALEESANESWIVVEAYKPGMIFTVISHALGDCLGNPLENRLPTCQVKSIQRIVSSLPYSPDIHLKRRWFWIDTLCVPLQHLQQQSTRGTVTKSMMSISQNAAQTLVLDSDISLLTVDSDAKEVFTRIAYSSWSSRLWTLQEALYARRLFFHFSDGNIDLDTLIMKYGNGPVGYGLPWHRRFPYKILRQYLDNTSENYRARSKEHCAFLLQALDGRATSDRSDEPLVIANLIGIDQDAADSRAELSKILEVLGLSGDANGNS